MDEAILYERFKKLNKMPHFTNGQFSNIFNISLKAAVLWLRDKKEKGYVKIPKAAYIIMP